MTELGQARKLRNYIAGEFKDAADARTTEIINPATGEVYATAPLSGQADVDAAMEAAAAAFPAWRDTTPAERQRALLKIADAFEERAEELIAAESENTGKPLGLTRSEEIPPMVDQIRFFAGAARMLEGRSAGEYMEGLTSFVRREPIGVCAQVAPWNYPMMMGVWKFAPALAAGNTVVLKPSDTTPASTVLMAEIIGSIVPKGVFNVICGDRDTGRAMVEHPTPAMASITGSVRAGMQVAESAAKDLKRVHLELGGKAPVLVFEDADIAAPPRASARPASSTPGRTAPPPPASWSTSRSTTASSRRSPRPRPTPRPGSPTTRTSSTAPSTTPTSSPRSPASSTASRPTPRSRRAATGSETRATSTPRPWSAA